MLTIHYRIIDYNLFLGNKVKKSGYTENDELCKVVALTHQKSKGNGINASS